MTVEYNAEVATVTFSGFLKLLIKWRGSIYKLLWQEFLIFAALYTILAVAYQIFMEGDDKKRFEEIVEYCSKFQENIPISFILGFYVNAVVSRWWEQFNSIPWPSRLSLIVTSHIRGQDDRSRMIRRTLMRYASLGYVMTMSSISVPVKKRFPTTVHLIEAGFLLPNEHKTLEELHTPYNKYYIPFVWAGTLVAIARKEGRINSDFGLQAILDEINAFRDKAQNLFNYDWVTIPLVYTQVATIAVYMFFLSCLMSRQNIPTSGTGDMIFPIFTLLQFFFYVGWLKVAEELLNPFGEDDDDFDINSLIDRNLRTSYLIVDEMHEDMPELVKDYYWDKLEVQIPYTEAALQHYKEAPLGSAEAMQIPEKQQQFVEEATSKLSLIAEGEEHQPEKTDKKLDIPVDSKAQDSKAPEGQTPTPPEKAHDKQEVTTDKTAIGSMMSFAAQVKDKLTHHTEPKIDTKADVEEGGVLKDVLKEDKTEQPGDKSISQPLSAAENRTSAAEAENRTSAAAENKTSAAAAENRTAAAAENKTSAAPAENKTSGVPAENKTSAPENKTSAAPAENKTSAAPAENKTSAAPAENKTSAPENKTSAAPAENKTSAAPAENRTSAAAAAAAALDQKKPDGVNTVTAEKVEKLTSPPPERSDAYSVAVEEPLENERFINNILSRLRKIRGKSESDTDK